MNAQTKKLPLVLAALSLCALFACTLDSRDEKKEKDLELQRWIYLALTTSRDVTGSCIAAETQGIACASAAGQTGFDCAATFQDRARNNSFPAKT